MNIIIGNILSFTGGLLDFVFSFKFNKKIYILQGNLISSSLSFFACLILHAYDGAINAVVTFLRILTIYIKEKYNKKFRFLFVVFLLSYALVFINFSGIQTILLFLGTMCAFVPKWISKNMQVIRVGELCANILIIFYNLAICNYAVISIQIISIILLIITICKWAIKKPDETKTKGKSNSKTKLKSKTQLKSKSKSKTKSKS